MAFVQLALAVGLPNIATLALEQWQRRRPPVVTDGIKQKKLFLKILKTFLNNFYFVGRMPYGFTPLPISLRRGGLCLPHDAPATTLPNGARVPVHAVWLLLRTRRAPFEGALDALNLLDLLHEQVINFVFFFSQSFVWF